MVDWWQAFLGFKWALSRIGCNSRITCIHVGHLKKKKSSHSNKSPDPEARGERMRKGNVCLSNVNALEHVHAWSCLMPPLKRSERRRVNGEGFVASDWRASMCSVTHEPPAIHTGEAREWQNRDGRNLSCVVCVWDLEDHWKHDQVHNHSGEPVTVFPPKA